MSQRRDLRTDHHGRTVCPDCNGNTWRAVKNPRLGPGWYEVNCDTCNAQGWIEQEDTSRP